MAAEGVGKDSISKPPLKGGSAMLSEEDADDSAARASVEGGAATPAGDNGDSMVSSDWSRPAGVGGAEDCALPPPPPPALPFLDELCDGGCSSTGGCPAAASASALAC